MGLTTHDSQSGGTGPSHASKVGVISTDVACMHVADASKAVLPPPPNTPPPPPPGLSRPRLGNVAVPALPVPAEEEQQLEPSMPQLFSGTRALTATAGLPAPPGLTAPLGLSEPVPSCGSA